MIFLAPVPIIHTESMLNDLSAGYKKFAFGSSALDFFQANIPSECTEENIIAYLFVSKTGEEHVDPKTMKQLGIFIRGRLNGWVRGDNRGKYPKTATAYRTSSALTDGPMACFWEVDLIERLQDRISLSDFISTSGRNFEDGFIPLGPMLLKRK